MDDPQPCPACGVDLALWRAEHDRLEAEFDRYREALGDIASRPVVERNPDGDDQAAHTMQMIARDAIEQRRQQARPE